jgi:hypothetical protein
MTFRCNALEDVRVFNRVLAHDEERGLDSSFLEEVEQSRSILCVRTVIERHGQNGPLTLQEE